MLNAVDTILNQYFCFQFLAILWWAMIPIAFSALLSGYLFYAHEYEKPSYWIAIYSAFGKNVWGLFGATLITGIAVNTGCEFEWNLSQLVFE